ncbi:MAG TPA: ShlB/FhaC/HecB family hemolysin secretion/activation protein [Verrucomicrobiales bacterium]|jgi:hemolysin activation/secretion protein|nr:ShlB/FhaC/HecB family hemolysin secretion/activation protein [Verrucomicrobiales bacterium]
MSRKTTRICLSPQGAWVRLAMAAVLMHGPSNAQEKPAEPSDPPALPFQLFPDAVPAEATFYIRQYRVKGAKGLPRIDVESAVYPFMGPECTQVHIQKAQAALQKAYEDKGYAGVSVSSQLLNHGVVILQVTETRVGRLQVKGSRYFSLDRIKKEFPSLAEGKMLNFKDVDRDLRASGRYPDRQISLTKESLKAREGQPELMDVDLYVKDKLPLHGSLELNNRNSPDTTKLRVNGAISYGNLWQAGHTLGLSFQVAPERPEDAKVFSAFYSVPVPSVNGLSLTFSGTKQDSDINTLGGAGVLGRGYMVGARANKVLPQGKSWVHSISGGFDFKHFDEDISIGETTVVTPVDYCPFSLTYNGTHVGATSTTDVNATLVFNIRAFGSSSVKFDAKRFTADSGFTILRADASHTRDLRNGMQLFGKVQGQLASGALINSEQFSGGGLSNVRGYLESTVQGDNAIMASAEVRSPSFIPIPSPKEGEMRATRPNQWRVYAFCEGGYLSNYDPLPEQDSSFPMASAGIGTAFRLRDHFNGSVDAAIPLIDQGTTDAGDFVVTFRMWADF